VRGVGPSQEVFSSNAGSRGGAERVRGIPTDRQPATGGDGAARSRHGSTMTDEPLREDAAEDRAVRAPACLARTWQRHHTGKQRGAGVRPTSVATPLWSAPKSLKANHEHPWIRTQALWVRLGSSRQVAARRKRTVVSTKLSRPHGRRRERHPSGSSSRYRASGVRPKRTRACRHKVRMIRAPPTDSSPPFRCSLKHVVHPNVADGTVHAR
jgi:hypothetical protein